MNELTAFLTTAYIIVTLVVFIPVVSVLEEEDLASKCAWILFWPILLVVHAVKGLFREITR